MKTIWDNEETAAKAEQMWKDGYSGTQIGAEIGVTRSAVMGWVNRRGLTRQKQGQRKPRTKPFSIPKAGVAKAIRRPKPERKIKVIEIPEATLAPEIDLFVNGEFQPLNISLFELPDRYGLCKMPYGTEAPFTFCGHRTVDTAAYCSYHSRMAYNPRVR